MPTDTGLLPHALVKLPAPDDIDVPARVLERLFSASETTLRDPSILQAMIGLADSSIIPSSPQALRALDALVSWRPCAETRKDPFRTIEAQDAKETQRLLGQALAKSILPALSLADRTEERFNKLISLIDEADASTAIAALPFFVGIRDDVRDTVVRLAK